MSSKNSLNDEYQQFLNAKSDGTWSFPERIVKDLVVSKARLSAIYVVGSVFGYILSLLICAQCSIGLSPLSWKLASYLHAIPDPWCPILCGSIFGISPSFVTVLYLSRFQHRYLIFRMGWLPAIIPVLGSLSLFLLGDTHSWAWRTIWLVSAILAPYLVEILSAVILRQPESKEVPSAQSR